MTTAQSYLPARQWKEEEAKSLVLFLSCQDQVCSGTEALTDRLLTGRLPPSPVALPGSALVRSPTLAAPLPPDSSVP
jgi:hypothetical protein